MVILALCDLHWKITKVIRSIPVSLAEPGQDAREIFADREVLDRLLEQDTEQMVSTRRQLRGKEHLSVICHVKACQGTGTSVCIRYGKCRLAAPDGRAAAFCPG